MKEVWIKSAQDFLRVSGLPSWAFFGEKGAGLRACRGG